MGSGRDSPRQRHPRAGAQQGAFAILSIPLLILMIVFGGLAVDMGQVYNRKVELSGMAKTAALAAARELNGKSEGIAAARAKAREAAQRFVVGYGESVVWNDAALTFGTTPDRGGNWVGQGIADASGYYYAKVDTAQLGLDRASVTTIFMPILSEGLRNIPVGDSAIAGRSGIKVAPLAVCAMSETRASERATGLASGELVEYGFRRGVSYDLMQLNPRGTTPARYMVNPVIPPGMNSTSFNTGIMGPFVCVGALWMPRVTGGLIRVSSLPAVQPLAALAAQLNARFDDYAGNRCFPGGSPPDTNIRAFAYDVAGGVPWMSQATGNPAARSTTERGWLETVADVPPPGSGLSGLNGGSYGPLWSYARAAKFSEYIPGAPEPAAGYGTFEAANWPTLYRAGVSAARYPWSGQGSPYFPQNITNPNTIVPPHTDRREFATLHRRVLYLPLLSCAGRVPAGSNVPATVVGVGKFFMTVPASGDTLIAEFAGVAGEQAIAGPVELYP